MTESQFRHKFVTESQFRHKFVMESKFRHNFETDLCHIAINKNYYIIYFFKIFINIKIFKKKPVTEAKIDSTNYRISL